MNRAQEIAKIMAAYEPGQTWQFRINAQCEWKDMPGNEEPAWNWNMREYRRKPEPQLRKWKTEEVPIGALIRAKNNPSGKAVITFAFGNEIWDSTPQGYGLSKYTAERALEWYEHSLDGGKTWLPCGVLE